MPAADVPRFAAFGPWRFHSACCQVMVASCDGARARTVAEFLVNLLAITILCHSALPFRLPDAFVASIRTGLTFRRACMSRA